MNFYLGIDFGTTGARGIVIDSENQTINQFQDLFPQDNKKVILHWQKALWGILEQLPNSVKPQLKAIAINGTSSTVLVCDGKGNPVEEAIMYNDKRGITVFPEVKKIAPENHVVLSSTSSLAKLLWFSSQPTFTKAKYFLHQADWLAFLLHGKLGISDYHNALKLGYDVENLCYPSWLEKLPEFELLPQVLPPGHPVAEITPEISQRFQLPQDCLVCTGTTDSIAAFLASGVSKPGEAVTSLGSTLVLKLLSSIRVENSQYGIYSHRLGDNWLTGGASNTGGAVLKHFFTDSQLKELSSKINLDHPSQLDYYPLLEAGERFPINDPQLLPKLTPRPDNQVDFLHGLLQSMAKIESDGYNLLQKLGATPLEKVYSAGGGAKNPIWRKIRQNYLLVPVELSVNTQAAYGTATLAKKSLEN